MTKRPSLSAVVEGAKVIHLDPGMMVHAREEEEGGGGYKASLDHIVGVCLLQGKSWGLSHAAAQVGSHCTQ